MAGVAVDPHKIVNDVARRAHDLGEAEAPTVLSRPPGPGAPLPSVQQGEEVAAVHRAWADAHAAREKAAETSATAGSGGGLEAMKVRLKARISSAAAAGLPDQDADRQVVGDLIRAVDALAHRIDELGGRLMALEQLVEEVVVVASEDLTRVRAALIDGGPRADDRSGGPPADG
jgi:hypothetical protein